MSSAGPFPDASIHGRFQVIHNEHLHYFRLAEAKYGRLYIGLTGQKADLKPDSGRGGLLQNPFSYWERAEMWRFLLSNIAPAHDHVVGPFPIEAVDRLPDFVPPGCMCVTTLREPWNAQKIEALTSAGYRVDVVVEDYSKHISGTMVRRLIAANDPAWESLVPPPVAEFLKSRGLIARLQGREGYARE